MQMRVAIIKNAIAANRTPIIVESEGMMYIIHTAPVVGVHTDVLTE